MGIDNFIPEQIYAWFKADYGWVYILFLLLSISFIRFVLAKKKHIVQVYAVIGIIATVVIAWTLHYQVLPLVLHPPKDKFVILITKFKPAAPDSENAALNFPHRLKEELDKKRVEDPQIEVKLSNVVIEGDNEDERTKHAQKIGRRKQAHLVIFGEVRCNEGIDGCTERYMVKPELVLTEGPVFPYTNQANIGGKEYIKFEFFDVSIIDEKVTFIYGLKQYQSREFGRAAEQFSKLKDNTAETWFYKGTSSMFLGMYKEAIDEFDEAILLDPKADSAYDNKGNALVLLGRDAEAIIEFDKAIALDPARISARRNKGSALYALGKYEEAVKEYDKAIAAEPNSVLPHFDKGLSLNALKKYLEAIKEFDEAIRLVPTFVAAYDNKGISLASLGKRKEAITEYDNAIRINYKYSLAHFNKGVSLGYIGNHKEAIAEYDIVIQINPKYAAAYYNKGINHNALGESEKAKVAFARAYELDPNLKIPRKYR